MNIWPIIDLELRKKYLWDHTYNPTTVEEMEEIHWDLISLGFECTNLCAEVVNSRLVPQYYQREYQINRGGNAPSNAEVAAGIGDRPNDWAAIRLPMLLEPKPF